MVEKTSGLEENAKLRMSEPTGFSYIPHIF